MPLLSTLVGLLVSLGVIGAPACSASTGTVSAGQPLSGGDRLISNNSKFALGFFQAPDTNGESSAVANVAPKKWYLGVWFNTVPNLTTVWVANSANPIMDAVVGASPELTISRDGDLCWLNAC